MTVVLTYVNPARAGMIRTLMKTPLTMLGKPRASGDDPRPRRAHRARGG